MCLIFGCDSVAVVWKTPKLNLPIKIMSREVRKSYFCLSDDESSCVHFYDIIENLKYLRRICAASMRAHRDPDFNCGLDCETLNGLQIIKLFETECVATKEIAFTFPRLN